MLVKNNQKKNEFGTLQAADQCKLFLKIQHNNQFLHLPASISQGI